MMPYYPPSILFEDLNLNGFNHSQKLRSISKAFVAFVEPLHALVLC